MTIIAALDFTEVSSKVAELGARLARRLGDKLLLLHAVEPSTSTYADLVPAPFLGAATTDVSSAVAGAEESLRRTRAALGDAGVEIETRVVLDTADRAVEHAVRETDARLVIAGTHGRGPIGRLMIGSVAQRLMVRLPCATLVIRNDGAAAIRSWLSGERPLRIVVGVDHKGRTTDAALDWVRRLSEVGPCDLTLVHEYWPPAEYKRLGLRGPRASFETDPEVAVILMRELEANVGTWAWSPNATLRVRASWGPIGDALAREAAEASADLVVVGSEQPHGWQRVKHASSALSALHAVAIPLLCVPVRAAPDPHPDRRALVGPAPRALLATTDLSEEGNSAIAKAFSLLHAQGGVVDVCYVAEHALPSPAYLYAADDGALTPARKLELEEQLRAQIPSDAAELGIEARVSVIDGGHAAEEIAAAALTLNVDAIVMASHGRGGVKRALLGSVTEAVMRRAEVPVYVVPRGLRDKS